MQIVLERRAEHPEDWGDEEKGDPDEDDHRDDLPHQVPNRLALVPGDGGSDLAAVESEDFEEREFATSSSDAHDEGVPDRDRRETADPMSPGNDHARERAGHEPEQDPRNDAHLADSREPVPDEAAGLAAVAGEKLRRALKHRAHGGHRIALRAQRFNAPGPEILDLPIEHRQPQSFLGPEMVDDQTRRDTGDAQGDELKRLSRPVARNQCKIGCRGAAALALQPPSCSVTAKAG